MESLTRLIDREDARALAALVRKNRAFLAPWEPLRDDSYYTVTGQREQIEEALARHDQGVAVPHVILDRPDESTSVVVGRINLNGIVRGPLQSCSVGYWVGSRHSGRGLATAALREMVGVAFGELGLHRVQAETLVHNVASQRVLEHTGFTRFGLAPQYLEIAGRWQDHMMFQLLNVASG